MIGNLFPTIKQSSFDVEPEQYENSFQNRKTTKQKKSYINSQYNNQTDNQNNDEWEMSRQVHQLGMVQHDDKSEPIEERVNEDIKAIFNMTVLRNKKTFSKQYIPLGSIVDNAYIKQHQIKNLHFEHIFLNSVNQNSSHKVVFKHNEETKEIRFYIPTFLRFSLIKLHSEDLKNITHIENKNNMIIYINVYTKGLPKMLIDKLTKRTKVKDVQEESKLLFRANRHLFQAKYYTSYNDYLIFMFNPFSEKMIEFQIMKNVMFAPFQQAELILHMRINKKVFKLERTKTLKIAKSSNKPAAFEPQSPIKRTRFHKTPSKSAQSIEDNIMEEQVQESQPEQQIEEQQFQILQFNKIIMEFKLQKPKNVTDSFRFHKSIEFGNYGIMTNEVNIHIGTYESPQKKKQLEEERQELNLDQEDLHEAQLEDISSMRLSIGLYKHPVTQLVTFFIPVMLAGGLTLLLFHLCDHSLTNELEVLAIILVAYGAFIPQFRERISMSRTVIFVDVYIVYNMIPAILCALQSITESSHKKSYNSYQVISVIMYYASALFLAEIYVLYLYVDRFYFKRNTKDMVHNFDTQIFETQEFQTEDEKCLSWFVLKSQKERAFFCERQDPVDKPKNQRIKFVRKETRYSSRLQDEIEEENKYKDKNELAQSIALEIRMSATTNKTLHEVKQTEDLEQRQKQHEQHEYLYKTKVIENQRHVHSFEKILSTKKVILGLLVILLILLGTIMIFWRKIYEMLIFEDLNKNCIHDEEEAQRMARVENIINKEEKLSKLIGENWNDASVPEPTILYDVNGRPLQNHYLYIRIAKSQKKDGYVHKHKKIKFGEQKHDTISKPMEQQIDAEKSNNKQNDKVKLRHHTLRSNR